MRRALRGWGALDIALLAAACLMVIGAAAATALFHGSLTDINAEGDEVLEALPYSPIFVSEDDLRTYADSEIEDAWAKKHEGERPGDMSVAQMSSELGMQPEDPGSLSDLVVVGTFEGERAYRYRAFVDEIRVERVVRPLSGRSALDVRGERYDIPDLDISEGDVIRLYEEFVVNGLGEGGARSVSVGASSNRYALMLTPLGEGERYLFFLNYVPRSGGDSLAGARFVLAPSVYAKIPLSGEPSVFDAALPTLEGEDGGEASPFGSEGAPVSEEGRAALDEFGRRYEEAVELLPGFTFGDATRFDLFAESAGASAAYGDGVRRVLEGYGLL